MRLCPGVGRLDSLLASVLAICWQTAATLGLIHLLLYVAFILLVPASLITAALLFAFNSWVGRRQQPKQGNQPNPAAEPLAGPKP